MFKLSENYSFHFKGRKVILRVLRRDQPFPSLDGKLVELELVSCSAGVTCNQNTMLKHRLSDLLKLNLKTVRVEVVEIHSIVHHINAYQNINS